MQPTIPSSISRQDLLNKSVAKVLAGNVSPGNGLTFDATGQPTTFSTDNFSGIIIRIGSLSNPYSLAAHWIAANTALTIAHNLNKIPYGFIVISKWAACDVYWDPATNPPTSTLITLFNTATVDTTILILA